MNLKSLTRRPLRTLIPRIAAVALDKVYDWRRNLNSGGPTSAKISPMRQLFREIQPLLPANPVMVDFGCGRGRPLFVAAEFGFVAARGVELDRDTYSVAALNLHRFKPTPTNIEIYWGDATEYKVRPDENVFFFCNPFGHDVLTKVLDNIMIEMQERRRKVLLVYYNPHANALIAKRTGFNKVIDRTMWGQAVTVFAN